MLVLILTRPAFSAPQSVGSSVSDSAAGLKSFLQQLAEVAASDDSTKASAAFQQLEIPDLGKWFYDLLGADPSKRVTVTYLINPRGREAAHRDYKQGVVRLLVVIQEDSISAKCASPKAFAPCPKPCKML